MYTRMRVCMCVCVYSRTRERERYIEWGGGQVEEEHNTHKHARTHACTDRRAERRMMGRGRKIQRRGIYYSGFTVITRRGRATPQRATAMHTWGVFIRYVRFARARACAYVCERQHTDVRCNEPRRASRFLATAVCRSVVAQLRRALYRA